jgi:Domain of unknown function (DUF5127)
VDQSNAVTFGVGSVDSLISNFIYLVLRHRPDRLASTITAFAFSRNLSAVIHNASAVFAFGFIQDPAVQSIDPNGQAQNRVPFFRTKYLSISDLVSSPSQL